MFSTELVCSVFSSTSLFVVVSSFSTVLFDAELTISCFNLLTPNLFIDSKATSNTNTIIAVIITIVNTATVLLNSCFGVGQITLFNSALKSLKKF